MLTRSRVEGGRLVIEHAKGCGCSSCEQVVDVSEVNIADGAVITDSLAELVKRVDPHEIATAARIPIGYAQRLVASGTADEIREAFKGEASRAWAAVCSDPRLISLAPEAIKEYIGFTDSAASLARRETLARRLMAGRVGDALAKTSFVPGATKKDTVLGQHITAQQFAHRFNADVLQREHVKNASKLVRELTDQYKREFDRLLGDIGAKLSGVTDPDARRALLDQMQSARGVIGARLAGLRQLSDEWGDKIKAELDGNAARSFRSAVDRAFDRLWDVDMPGNTIAGESAELSLARQEFAKANMVKEFFRVNQRQLEVGLGNTPLLAGRVRDQAKKGINDIIVRSSFLRGANAKYAAAEIKREFARDLEGLRLKVDARARFIARTETARIQAEGDLRTQQELGVERVEVFYSAGAFPCQICPDIAAGGPYPINRVPEGGIPFHPNCRCSYGPFIDPNRPLVSPLWNEGENRAADAIVVVKKDGVDHMLVIERQDGSLALPGGFVDGNAAGSEAARQSAIREVEEETGLKLKTRGEHVGYFKGPGRDPRDGLDRHVSSRGFLHNLGDVGNKPLPKVKGLDDARAAHWVPVNQVTQREMYADHRDILNSALRLLDRPAFLGPPEAPIEPTLPPVARVRPQPLPRPVGAPTHEALGEEIAALRARGKQLGTELLGYNPAEIEAPTTRPIGGLEDYQGRVGTWADSVARGSQFRPDVPARPGEIVDEMFEINERIYRARLRQLALANETEREQILGEIADRIIERGQILANERAARFGNVPGSARLLQQEEDRLREAVISSLRVHPDDMVARSEIMVNVSPTEERGFSHSTFINSGWRFDYGQGYRDFNVTTMDHELGHTWDEIFGSWRRIEQTGDLTNNGRSWSQRGAIWRGETAADRTKTAGGRLQKLFHRQADAGGRTYGAFFNGDGRFWKDNWVHDYEGRIYEFATGGGDSGVEFITMNAQRYLAEKRLQEESFAALVGEGFDPELAASIARNDAVLTAGVESDVRRAVAEMGLADEDVADATRVLSKFRQDRGYTRFAAERSEVRDWKRAQQTYGAEIREAMEEIYGPPRLNLRVPADIDFGSEPLPRAQQLQFDLNVSKPTRALQAPPPAAPSEGAGAGASAKSQKFANAALRTGEGVNVEWGGGAENVARRLLRGFKGDVSEQRLASLVGAPEGSTLTITKVNDTEIFIKGSGAGLDKFERIIRKELDGFTERVVMLNEWFVFEAGERGGGSGAITLATQVSNAIEAGIDVIQTKAGGQKGSELTGYIVWPMLGYDGPIAADKLAIMPDAIKAACQARVEADAGFFARLFGKLRPITIRDVYEVPGGQEWWAEHGSTIGLKFDLGAKSKERAFLKKYLKARGLKDTGNL